MTELKCETNEEDSCKILNKELGDCEIYDETTGRIVWRCSKLKEIKQKRNIKKMHCDYCYHKKWVEGNVVCTICPHCLGEMKEIKEKKKK